MRRRHGTIRGVRYSHHRMGWGEIIGWALVVIVGTTMLATFVIGSTYIAACDVHGINMCH